MHCSTTAHCFGWLNSSSDYSGRFAVQICLPQAVRSPFVEWQSPFQAAFPAVRWFVPDPSASDAATFQPWPFPRRHYEIKLTANSCIAVCSSKNAVSISSTHNEPHPVTAMRVCNPDGSSLKIETTVATETECLRSK